MKKIKIMIDEQVLEDTKKSAGVKSIREVIEIGLHSLVQQSNRESLRKELGTYDIDLTLMNLESLRNTS